MVFLATPEFSVFFWGGSTTTRNFLMDPGKGGVSGIYSDNSGVPVSFFFLCDVNVASVFFGFVGSLWWGFPFQRRNQPPAFNEIDDDNRLFGKGVEFSSQWPDVISVTDLEECNKNKHVNKGEMFISFPSFFVGCILCTHNFGGSAETNGSRKAC